jgi:hypothetical protein
MVLMTTTAMIQKKTVTSKVDFQIFFTTGYYTPVRPLRTDFSGVLRHPQRDFGSIGLL